MASNSIAMASYLIVTPNSHGSNCERSKILNISGQTPKRICPSLGVSRKPRPGWQHPPKLLGCGLENTVQKDMLVNWSMVIRNHLVSSCIFVIFARKTCLTLFQSFSIWQVSECLISECLRPQYHFSCLFLPQSRAWNWPIFNLASCPIRAVHGAIGAKLRRVGHWNGAFRLGDAIHQNLRVSSGCQNSHCCSSAPKKPSASKSKGKWRSLCLTNLHLEASLQVTVPLCVYQVVRMPRQWIPSHEERNV